MKGIDEDSPLTGLASAWINMAMVWCSLFYAYIFALGWVEKFDIGGLHLRRAAAEIRQERFAA